ncbi:hypothetical protein BCY88_20500 [Paraburkholderia fungorum]|uniref:Uncharacterized protein n=1 Tax=Paraburkholderia fungorum TaxID=134537 RepID=A0A420GTS0_9BURK|nr:hypothetical protein BCY88_20500 [Paraburkholderia fungorum]
MRAADLFFDGAGRAERMDAVRDFWVMNSPESMSLADGGATVVQRQLPRHRSCFYIYVQKNII